MAEMIRGKSQIEVKVRTTLEGFSDMDVKNGGTLAPEDVMVSFKMPEHWMFEENPYKDEIYLVVRARDVLVLDDRPGGDSLVGIVSSFSDRIKNGRTKETIFEAISDEVLELRDELEAEPGAEGPDGIFGECIDIIASTLDLIRMEYPDMPVEELERKCADYLRLKCDKWERKYG